MTCSITVKFRTYELAAQQPADGPPNFDENEQIHGPFEFVSKEMKDGYPVVHCHVGGGDPGISFSGRTDDPAAGVMQSQVPRPTLWVMNYYGATIAKYDL